jgi:hypothetical protein
MLYTTSVNWQNSLKSLAFTGQRECVNLKQIETMRSCASNKTQSISLRAIEMPGLFPLHKRERRLRKTGLYLSPKDAPAADIDASLNTFQGVVMKYASGILVLLSLCLATPASAQFKKPTLYTVGVEPQLVVAADVNHDGHIDLIAPDFTSLQLSILLGNGDGTFQSPISVPTKLDPSALALGDFNGDGHLDLAVTEYDTQSSVLQIFLGNGDGTFTAEKTYSVPQSYSLTAGDFDGDGHIDLAVADEIHGRVIVLRGNGDGTFSSFGTYTVPEPERVLAVDLNGDGHLDLAVLAYCGKNVNQCTSGAVAVLLNNGSGKFKPSAYFTVNGVGPDGIAAADLNGDGKVDLVVANNNFQQPSTISVLLGNGNGTFQAPVNYNVGSGPAGIAIADYNRDGKLDVAVANTASATVSLLYGNGNGTLQPAKSLHFAANSLPIYVATADFNGDGSPDIAVALCYANQIAVQLNAK